MAEVLDDEWIAALDRRLRDDAAVARAAEHASLTIEHVVRDPDGREHAMHITARAGSVRAAAGRAPADAVALVRFVTGAAAAGAVSAGATGTRAAVLGGDIRVEGDVGALVAHRALLPLLDAATADLRAA